MPPKNTFGFTLAELLIALAILGVIATITIPKVLTAQQDSKRSAVIKEVVATLNDITYQGVLKRDGLDDSTFYEYYYERLNQVKSCPNDINVEGCWTQAFTSSEAFPFQGYVLHNGAAIAGFSDCCDYGGGAMANVIAVDWNGDELPNVAGQDQFDLVVSYGTAPFVSGGRSYRPGTVLPLYSDPNSVTVYESVFK